MSVILLRLAVAATLLAGTAAAALADPPDRVGRISLVEGDMAVQTTDQPQWAPAGINYPVMAGEALWTQPQSRAEIQVGPVEVRLDGQTEIDVPRLDDGGTVVRVDQGVANIHVLALPPGGVQVVTRAGQLDLQRPGSYHVDAGRPGPDGSVGGLELAVLDGAAQLTGPRTSVEILPGEGAAVAADTSTLTLVAATPTPFDDWALARERREMAPQSAGYLSPETTGYQDLDSYGQWAVAPGYGPVWYPAVAPDWAPYRYGHWAYVTPWGWTWIDDAPWGFAPFHYGRWVDLGDRWAWLPDPPGERPVYAPALVVFFGGGPSLGWVPLGPHEAFHPYYPASDAYARRFTVAYHGEFRPDRPVADYANRRGATMVPQAAFTGGSPANRSRLTGPDQQFSQQRTMPDLGHEPAPAGGPRPPASEGHAAAPPAGGGAWHQPEGQQPQRPTPPAPAYQRPASAPPTYQRPAAPTYEHPAAPTYEHPAAPTYEHPAAPQAAYEHPAQPARLTPTPQGWVRTPAQEEPRHEPPPHQPQPQAQPQAPQGQQHGQDHRNEPPQGERGDNR
jgi:hypothetical protein